MKIQLENLKNKWDIYFATMAMAASHNSPCLSRKEGAILVKDNSVISTGFNGPPRHIPHCGKARMKSDPIIFKRLRADAIEPVYGDDTMCPRYRLGFGTGEGLHLCPSIHAEVNALLNASRQGISTYNSTMYLTCGIPCKNCFGSIINAGVNEVVCSSLDLYDDLSRYLISETDVSVRVYE